MLNKIIVGFLIVSWCMFSPLFAAHIVRNIIHDIRARGKCRTLLVENNSVRIVFMNNEDAKLFANDIVTLINEENNVAK